MRRRIVSGDARRGALAAPRRSRCHSRRRTEAPCYPQGADPEQLTREYTTSADFAADMAGFDPNEIVDVQSLLLDPTPFSPIR